MDFVREGSLDIRSLDYKAPQRKPRIRRMTKKSRVPGSNEIRKIHAQGRRMAVPR